MHEGSVHGGAGRGRDHTGGLIRLLGNTISACREARRQYDISRQATNGFEGVQAISLINSISAGLKALTEVIICWDGTITFVDPAAGSDLLARLFDPDQHQHMRERGTVHKPGKGGCTHSWGSAGIAVCKCNNQARLTNLEVYIDDGSMQVKGPRGRVAPFEIACGLPVSRKKLKVVASSARLGNQIAAGLGKLGCSRANSPLVLGVQHTAGTGGAQRQGGIRMNAFD